MAQPGTGKTILANQICFNHVAEHGSALYVSLLAESHTRMLQHLRSMTFFDEAAMPRLYYVSATPTFINDGLSGIVELVKGELKRRRPGIMVIDGFSATRERAESQQEFQRFIHEIQSHAAAAECAVLLLTSGIDPMKDPAATMVDGIVQLNHVLFERRTQRTLASVEVSRPGFPSRNAFVPNHRCRIRRFIHVVEARFSAETERDQYALTRCSHGHPRAG